MKKERIFLKSGLTNVAPDIGIGAAAGKVASEVFKHTAGMPGPARLASVTLAAGGTAFGTKVGIEMGKAMVSNDKKLKEIEASKVDTDSDSEGRNSPSNFDGGFIHSVLDESVIPLIIMVNGFWYLNYIEFSLILCLFSLFFRKYLLRKLKILILNLKNKYIKNIEVESIKNENLTLNKVLNTVDKYTDSLILFIFICLIWIKLLSIFFINDLVAHIDKFVIVYNSMKKNSFMLLFTKIKVINSKKKIFSNKKNK